MTCEGSSFEVKICKAKPCPNERTKKQTKKLTPFIVVPTTQTAQSVEVFDDYDYEPSSKYENTRYEYAEGRPVEFVPPPKKPKDTLNETVPHRVTIRVSNYIPIPNDMSQVRYLDKIA